MAVGIKGYLYTGMAETLLNNLGMSALFEHQRSMAMRSSCLSLCSLRTRVADGEFAQAVPSDFAGGTPDYSLVYLGLLDGLTSPWGRAIFFEIR